jgi:hypothetical protein
LPDLTPIDLFLVRTTEEAHVYTVSPRAIEDLVVIDFMQL